MAQQYALPGKNSLAEPETKLNAHYRKMREPFAAELKDPATRRLLKGILSAENPGAKSAVVESLMNRTAMVNEQRALQGKAPLTLKDMIRGHGDIGGGASFYGPIRTGAVNQHLARIDADRAYSDLLDSHIMKALGGADTIAGHTDQGSKGDPNYITGGVGVNINGERFNDWGFKGSRAWREKQQALAAGQGSAGRGDEMGEGGPTATAPSLTASGGDSAGEGGATATGTGAGPNTISQTTPTATDVVASAKKQTDWREAIGDALQGVGTAYAKAPQWSSTPANAAVPIAPTPSSPVSMVDPKVADAQRQQLALALQRLNAGRLV